jgi:NAD(P)H-hydrate epimerase
MTKVDIHSIQKLFQKRLLDSHKGSHGHALLIVGNYDKMGAAIIASKASMRAGAGLITVNIPKEERMAIFTSIPEAMIEFREEKNDWSKFKAIGIGPGIGIDNLSKHFIKQLLEATNQRIVFDADALTILAKNQQWYNKLPNKSILTPHAKEFDRLFGNHNSESERRQTATTKAKELQLIIVLKGHKTFITDGEESFENTTGNSGLAKGGSGDALTGIITAFLAQVYEPLNAALLGVYIHGLAADITLETQSQESMLITDVIENLGKAIKKIQN